VLEAADHQLRFEAYWQKTRGAIHNLIARHLISPYQLLRIFHVRSEMRRTRIRDFLYSLNG